MAITPSSGSGSATEPACEGIIRLVRIRDREQADLQPCVELLEMVHVANQYPTLWPVDPRAWLSPAGLLTALVAVQQDEILGHVAVIAKPEQPDREVVELSRLFVSSDHQRRGVGAALADSVVDYARQLGCGLVLVVVDDRSGTLGFYQRRGWRFTGRTPANWQLCDGSRPTLAHFQYPCR